MRFNDKSNKKYKIINLSRFSKNYSQIVVVKLQ